MKKKTILVLSSILLSTALVGATFATYAVTDLAGVIGANVTTREYEEDGTTYVTLSWGSGTSLSDISNMAPGKIYKLGVLSLQSTVNYTGPLSVTLEDESSSHASDKKFIDYVKLYLYEGSNDAVEEGELPDTGYLASTSLGGTSLVYNALGTTVGKRYSLYVEFDSSALPYLSQFESDVVGINVDWSNNGEDEVQNSHTVYFATDWSSCYLYSWSSKGENAKYPGVELNKIGVNQYDQNIYKGILLSDYDHMIFSDGSEYNKTINLSVKNFDFSGGDLLFWKDNDQDLGVGTKVFDYDSDINEAANYAYNMGTNPGPVLQAWGWKLSKVEERLGTIKAAGYNAVQVSPLQPMGSAYEDQRWSMMYQPYGFSVAGTNQNPIGDATSLAKLTKAADKLGIDIIVDVVCNHLAADPDNNYHLNPGVVSFEPDIYNNNLIHSGYGEITDTNNSNGAIIRGNLGKLPDLKTEDKRVQDRVISLLKDYINLGVKGFRFDAAKHIETPEDGEYASNFWPRVIGEANKHGIKTYGKAPYSYGEVLGLDYRNWGGYTSYLDVTDNGVSWSTRTAFNSGNAYNVLGALNYSIYNTASYAMLFAESHDNYTHNETTGTYGPLINMAYGLHASRADASSFYFARPSTTEGHGDDTYVVVNEPMGDYCNSIISSANKLHNDFNGGGEYLSTSEGCVINAREYEGNYGAYICSPTFASTVNNIYITAPGGGALPDGVYTNLVNGESVTVSGGKCNVNLVEGVAVLERFGGEIDHTVAPNYGFAIKVDRGGSNLYYSATDTNTESYGKHVYKVNSIALEAGDKICMYDGGSGVAFNCAGSSKLYLDTLVSGAFTYQTNYLDVNTSGTYTIELQLASSDDSYYIYK